MRDVGAGGYTDGAPIGGFGAGTVTWKNNGVFYLTRLNIGTGDNAGNFTSGNANCRFYMYQKPLSGAASARRLNAATLGSGQASYYSLFPFSWVDYHGSYFNVKAKVTQYSPLIPNDYQRVSYPLGIYEWELANPTGETYETAVMLTWENPYGASASLVSSGSHTGLVLNKAGTGTPTLETQGEFCLASLSSPSVLVTRMSAANVSTLETDFTADGELSDTAGNHTIGAVAFKVTLAPGESVRIPIVLSWDIPIAQAGSGQKWYRKYTAHFDRSGTNSWAIAREALTERASWESQLDTWQDSILTNPYYPQWLKSMLFNELYMYFTGGTYWEAGSASGYPDNPDEYMFSHLESYIYDFYGTSDVRFYGSWALFLNWPDIDKQCVRQFADSVYNTRPDRPAGLGTTAHDFGDRSDVFTRWNAYVYRDSTNWKDLNSKLVLMVYRNWHLTGRTDSAFLDYCWESCKIAMEKTHSQDSTGNGLPDSNGIDQTYDDMELTGNTAYCGGLYLASLLAAKELALAKGETALANTYQARFDFAQPNYEADLWTGEYYRIDTGSSAPNRIMSDQLAGQWYTKACGLPNIVPDARAESALQKIHDFNWAQFGGGSHGVVNVMNPNGTIDNTSNQTAECWVGTSWGVVSSLLYHGLVAQADEIGQSLYNTIWNTAQYWFRTPEAWQVNLTSPRAFYYMRATAIWGAKHAYDRVPDLCSPNTCTPPPTPTYTYTPSPTPTVNPCAVPLISVNCGAGSYTDTMGTVWSADQAYAPGGWGYVNGAAETITTNQIANTNDDTLYQSGRWANPSLQYRFTVPDGQWRVLLKFAEIYWNSPNQRVMNVTIEGTQVITGFDIVASAGGAFSAYDLVFDVVSSGGTLDISFNASIDSGKVSAIQILDPSVLCTPTVTPTGSPPTITFTRTRTFTPTPTEFHSATVTPTNTPFYSPTITSTATITMTATATPVFAVIRVNAGGPQYTDGGGNIWAADKAYTAGTWGYQGGGGTADAGAIPIGGTTDDVLYRTERYGNPSYIFDNMPQGDYTVTFKFAENYWTNAGERVFNVMIEGATVISSLDIYSQAGANYALDRVVNVTITDGQMNITSNASVDGALFMAIQIEYTAPTPTRTPSASPALTFTGTSTPVPPTATFTRTSTATPSFTSQVPSFTATPTHTRTVTVTFTKTRTGTPTFTETVTPSFTFQVPSFTTTHTFTRTSTPTPTRTGTPTSTHTPSITETWTLVPPDSTLTWTPTRTPTFTHSATLSVTPSATGSRTPSFTATVSSTATMTATPSFTETHTNTRTSTPTFTQTGTPTHTPSITETWTPVPPDSTATFTPTITPTFTRTSTATPSFTFQVPSFTATPTHTRTVTFTFTGTRTVTPTVTRTGTPTSTRTATPTVYLSVTPTFTATPLSESAVFRITKAEHYPQPFNPLKNSRLYVDFSISQGCERVVFSLYTAGYRRILEKEIAGRADAGSHRVFIEAAELGRLSNGSYFWMMEAVSESGERAGGRVSTLVILK